LGALHHILDELNSITHSVYWISIHPTCDAIHQNTKILQASHIGCTGIGHHTLGAWHHAFGVSNCNTPNVWCQKHNHPFITNITHWVCWVIGIIQWVYWFAIYPMCDAKHPNIPFVTGITYWVYRVCGMIHWVHGITQWVYWCAIHPVRDANHPTTQPPNHPTTQPPNHPTTQPPIEYRHHTIGALGMWHHTLGVLNCNLWIVGIPLSLSVEGVNLKAGFPLPQYTHYKWWVWHLYYCSGVPTTILHPPWVVGVTLK